MHPSELSHPNQLHGLSIAELEAIARQIRHKHLEVVSTSGGHLGPGLGVVELTLALYQTLDLDQDRVCWDVALEAINHAGHLPRTRLLVVLNDNDMSISPPVGALSTHLNRMRLSKPVQFLSGNAEEAIKHLPFMHGELPPELKNLKESMRRLAVPKVGAVFEELGFTYMGPIDGHDMAEMIRTFQAAHREEGPVLVHVATTKGKGYAYAEADQVGYHAQSAFDLATGKAYPSSKPKPPSWSKVFGQTLVRICEQDPRVVGITAAMATGTGLDLLEKALPGQYFDVGIAEQHAVTMAAGMACEGLRPVVAIYSTFLQRAYDQLIHDVGIQKLPVTFVLDRAGIVGADGPTHQGQYDISYLRSVPNFTVMAPKDEGELQRMLVTSIAHDGPCAIRIPRGEGEGVPLIEEGWQPLEIGRGELLADGDDVLIVAYGSMVYPAMETAGLLQEQGVRAAVINARFLRPLDEALILPMARRIGRVVTMEEGALAGGFGAAVVESLSDHEVLVPVLRLGIGDVLVDHASPEQSKVRLGLTPAQMAESILKRFAAAFSPDSRRVVAV